jgi:GNAT superfamily N-acetyltransferase
MAQDADVDALVICINAAYAKYNNRISDMPSVSDNCADEIAANRVWVVTERDEIIGCVILFMEDDCVKLANLSVHPDHSGKGVGRKLMAFSEREAMKRGHSEMRLNTHAAMPENIQLYTHLGWHKSGRKGNTVQMVKSLKVES